MTENKEDKLDFDDPFGIFEDIGDFDFLPEAKRSPEPEIATDDNLLVSAVGTKPLDEEIDLLDYFKKTVPSPAVEEINWDFDGPDKSKMADDAPPKVTDKRPEESESTSEKSKKINSIAATEDNLGRFEIDVADKAADVFDFTDTNSVNVLEIINDEIKPDNHNLDDLSFNKAVVSNTVKRISAANLESIPKLPFEEMTEGNAGNSKAQISFTSQDEIAAEIKEKRAYVEFEQQFETERQQMTWEMFLVMQLIGRVAYLTKGQMLRYLAGWKQHFEKEIKADMGVIQTLIRKKWISRTSRPIDFSRGDLNGHKIYPYIMTRSGRMAFGRYDVETANLARVGEPEGKMFDRLEHELLISEVYVHLIEQGNFIYWFMSEENMRREIVQNIWKMWRKREDMTLTNNRLGDFKICYFDKQSGRVEMREGEIAVRYKRGQIMLKSDDLWWFCYSEAEAEKIKLITKKSAVVLTDKLYREVVCPVIDKRKEKGDKKRNDVQTEKWVRALGGLTVETGALLIGVKYLTMWRRLKKAEHLKVFLTAFQPGAGAGRPISFYVMPEILDTPEKRRAAFILNLGVEVLVKKGFSVHVKETFISVYNEKKGEAFQLVADETFFSTDAEWTELVPAITEKIERGKKKNMKTILLVADEYNIYHYYSSFPNEVILNLNEHF